LTSRPSPLGGVFSGLTTSIARHPDRTALLSILLAAVAIRLAFTFRAPLFLVHDSITYFQAGYDFARGYGFELAFKRTPLYPLFIAAVVAVVSEDLQALGFVQHLLGIGSALMTYLLGRALFGRPAGLIAGLLVALSGPLIIYEHYILAEPIFIPLLLAFALALVRGVRSATASPSLSRAAFGWLALAGLLLALAGLARPVGQAILLTVPFALWVALRSWRRAALASLATVAAFGLVTSVWMLRNYVQQGSFESAGALGQTLTGRIVRHDEGFVIPSPDSPSPYADPVKTEARALILRQMARDARPSAINHRVRTTFGWTEAEANRAMRDVCLEIITAQKERYVVGTLKKLGRLLWGDQEDFLSFHWANRKSNEMREDWTSNPTIAHLLTPPSSQQEADKYDAQAIVNVVNPYALRWPLALLLLVGLVVGWRRPSTRWAVVFIVLVVLALAAPAAALVGFVPRYRYPADPFMAVVIGGGLAWLAERAMSLPGLWRKPAATPARQDDEPEPARLRESPT
jgi:4-amino-4-deoxy-L-arabinose transferase-like glycosyltransferase